MRQGFIYKLFCLNSNITDCYIGSTCNIKKRIQQHKSSAKRQYPLRLYKFINNNGGFCQWSYEILEEYDSIDRKELFKIEKNYIQDLKPTLNSNIPDTPHQISYHNYYLRNRAKINGHKLRPYECVCGSIVSHSNRFQHMKSNKHTQQLREKRQKTIEKFEKVLQELRALFD